MFAPTVEIKIDPDLGPYEVECYAADGRLIGRFDVREGMCPSETAVAYVPYEGFFALNRNGSGATSLPLPG